MSQENRYDDTGFVLVDYESLDNIHIGIEQLEGMDTQSPAISCKIVVRNAEKNGVLTSIERGTQ